MFTKRYLVFSHGKRARRKSPKADFSSKLANRAEILRFALSHSRDDDDGYSVTFPMSLDGPAPGYILKWLGTVRSFRVRTRKAALAGGSGRWRQLVASTPPKDEGLF